MPASQGLRPDLSFEVQAGFPAQPVAGCDEVGRGCLAGPVVAAAVIPGQWDPDPARRPAWLSQITDSKALSPQRRTELAPLIQGWARAWAIAEASVEEIDRLNIFHASLLAMERALEALKTPAAHALIDGKFAPLAWKAKATVLVKGDARSLSIACASILAKVHRDQGMTQLESHYPGYGFAVHKGYGTPAHLVALRAQGPCVLHRRSFGPVAALLT